MTTKSDDTEVMSKEAAASLRKIALEIAGDDPHARERALRIAYEGFIRGMTSDTYSYGWEGRAAARAMLGLTEPKEDA